MRVRALGPTLAGLLLAAGTTLAVEEGASPSGTFGQAGFLVEARTMHTATLLPDDRVLVIGGTAAPGEAAGVLASVELWDPGTASFASAGNLLDARAGHAAALLSDGRVLVVGGDGGEGFLASAEAWDPSDGTTRPAGELAEARSMHTATRLPDGRVLVVGGVSATGAVALAEIWDPVTEAFTPAGELGTARSFHTATLLEDGRVLVAGGLAGPDIGSTIPGAEIWEPQTSSFTDAGAHGHRALHAATRLSDGRVLIAGGFCGFYCPIGPQTEASLWDPETAEWSSAGFLEPPRAALTATTLPDGRVLLTGGKVWWGDMSGTLPYADLWDPATRGFSPVADMASARGFHSATLLSDGRVLLVGGDATAGAVSLAEVWTTGDASGASGDENANDLLTQIEAIPTDAPPSPAP